MDFADPAPPQVTVVNPNHPTGTPDLLHNGRDPWRPTRRQVLITAGVLCLLALIGAAGTWFVHVRHEARLDRAEVRGVRIFTMPTCCELTTENDTFLTLTLRNDGPDPVTLVAARYSTAPPWKPDSTLVLYPGQSTDLPVPTTVHCTPRSGRGDKREVYVDLVLPHGAQLTRIFPLDEPTALQAESTVRSTCGTLAPGEAVQMELVESRISGRALVLHYLLSNNSIQPMTITKVAPSTGLSATGLTLPMHLPPRDAAHVAPRTVDVTLRVTMRSCAAFRRNQTGAEPTQPHVTLGVVDAVEAGTAWIGLNTENDGPVRSEVDALALLRSWCGLPTLYRG